jgi:hypothetical protein
MLPDKYIGLILALCSTFLIGLSFTLTKQGLTNAKKIHGMCTFLSLYIKILAKRVMWDLGAL